MRTIAEAMVSTTPGKASRRGRRCSAAALPLLLLLLPSLDCRNGTTSGPIMEVDWDDPSVYRSGLTTGARDALDLLTRSTVYHIDLTIPRDYSPLRGREQIRYINRTGTPLDEIYLRFYHNPMPYYAGNIIAASVDGKEVAPLYEMERGAVRLQLPKPLPDGKEALLDLEFEAELTVWSSGDYFGMIGYLSDLVVLDKFYPVIPVHEGGDWRLDEFQSNGDQGYLDASFYLVRLTAPTDHEIVATGIQIDRSEIDESQTVTYAAGPVREFYLAASDAFTVVSDTLDETVVRSYASRKRAAGGQRALEYAVNALKSFSHRLGPYPYTEFELVSVPMFHGGMEYPGVVAIALTNYTNRRKKKLEEYVAHEVAHQWFYNMVGNDQVEEPWLDESLAQYATKFYYLDIRGEEAAERYAERDWGTRWNRVGMADIPVGMPSRDYSAREYTAIVYGRGAVFLQELETLVGEERFGKFLRDHCDSHMWKIATTGSFKELAEKHCECDLTQLFEEWIYSP
ncbi:MAG: M1 family metallopeptidase [Bacteroidota bacterium]